MGQSNLPVLKQNNNSLSEPVDKAIALNSQYTSVFTREPNVELPVIDDDQTPPMPDIYFTTTGIMKFLLNLGPSSASGPDLLPTRVLKIVILCHISTVVRHWLSTCRLAECQCNSSLQKGGQDQPCELSSCTNNVHLV